MKADKINTENIIYNNVSQLTLTGATHLLRFVLRSYSNCRKSSQIMDDGEWW